MIWHVLSVTFAIVFGIAIVLTLAYVMVCVFRILRCKFRYTKLYKYMVEHEAFDFSVKDRERWEKIKAERWGQVEIDKQRFFWDGEYWKFVPDIMGDGIGAFVRENDILEYRAWPSNVRVLYITDSAWRMVNDFSYGDSYFGHSDIDVA